ncbi:MAG: DUF2796 domain-containing protein [Rubrivivax sp.]|jgi:hypothetical protein|nr:DUF2796 domain-containing protein [Rubrivivax sp.]
MRASASGFARTAAGLVAALVASPLLAGKAHEHGVGRLDLATEPAAITIAIDLPLEAVVGFERPPRDDAERARAEAMLARLRDAAALFSPDPAAGCKPGAVTLDAPVLQPGAAAPKDGHADLAATYAFTCSDGHRAAFVEVRLFDALPRLQRIEVQAVTRKGQMKAVLRRPATRVALAR